MMGPLPLVALCKADSTLKELMMLAVQAVPRELAKVPLPMGQLTGKLGALGEHPMLAFVLAPHFIQ